MGWFGPVLTQESATCPRPPCLNRSIKPVKPPAWPGLSPWPEPLPWLVRSCVNACAMPEDVPCLCCCPRTPPIRSRRLTKTSATSVLRASLIPKPDKSSPARFVPWRTPSPRAALSPRPTRRRGRRGRLGAVVLDLHLGPTHRIPDGLGVLLGRLADDDLFL